MPGLNNYDSELPYVQNLTVVPNQIQFSPTLDGQKDTTITLDLSVEGFSFETDSVPYYYIFYSGDVVPALQGKLNVTSGTSFQKSITIGTNTTLFNSYTILIRPSLSGENKNYAQTRVIQAGVPINAPVILEVSNPDTLYRPQSGANLALFTAKVTDVDGQSNIDKVLIRIIDQEVGEAQGSPFEMFDDGTTYNDATPSDSIYTFSLPVTITTNRPNRNFNIEFYALDKSGLSSDTTKVNFRIRE